jgi:hypothetical protein
MEPRRVNAVDMFSIAARFHVPIWVGCTPYSFDNSAIVISSRIASSATLALKSPSHRYCVSTAGQWYEWFFRFVIFDHLFHKLIHLNYWSEILRPPLSSAVRDCSKSQRHPYS